MLEEEKIAIVTPVYNDWSAFSILLTEIDKIAEQTKLCFEVFVVDDGSIESSSLINFNIEKLKYIKNIELITLARNLGHQKAIAVGLSYINSITTAFNAVIVMDSDGEDRPEDIPKMIEALRQEPKKIIFASRKRRNEDIIFRLSYKIYKLFFWLLTGKHISFGNFCCIPGALLSRLVFLPEIWNHFAAGVLRSGLPFLTVEADRGKRYDGQTKMNFVSLVTHGFSAMSVYVEIITVRLMIMSSLIIFCGFIAFCILLYIKYFTVLAIPGWATNVAIGLVMIKFQAVLLLTMLAFIILSYRSNKLFVPAKDFHDYFLKVEKLR